MRCRKRDQRTVAQARSYAQSFTSIFGSNVPPPTSTWAILSSFYSKNSHNTDVQQAAQERAGCHEPGGVAEKHGPRNPARPASLSISPTPSSTAMPTAGAQSYTAIADRLPAQSLWDDYLAFHYGGRASSRERLRSVTLGSAGATRFPGAGDPDFPIRLSDTEAAPGSPVTIERGYQRSKYRACQAAL